MNLFFRKEKGAKRNNKKWKINVTHIYNIKRKM